jgi:hypothetical protein
MLIRLGVCVCYGETVRERFERTESNTESNCALFGHMPGARFSDGANQAIEVAMGTLSKPDWKKVFDKQSLDESIRMIVN